MRGKHELEFPELADIYQDNVPDFEVQLTLDDGNYSSFQQPVFVRPYL